VAASSSGNFVDRINEVALHWARLLLGCLTTVLSLLPAKATAGLFFSIVAQFFCFFLCQHDSHEPLHLARWKFAWICILTTARTLSNFKVKKGKTHMVFCVSCMRDNAWTRWRGFTKWRHFITACGSDWLYPWAVLSLRQGLMILFQVVCILDCMTFLLHLQVRIFRFASGKITKVFDESLQHYSELQQVCVCLFTCFLSDKMILLPPSVLSETVWWLSSVKAPDYGF